MFRARAAFEVTTSADARSLSMKHFFVHVHVMTDEYVSRILWYAATPLRAGVRSEWLAVSMVWSLGIGLGVGFGGWKPPKSGALDARDAGKVVGSTKRVSLGDKSVTPRARLTHAHRALPMVIGASGMAMSTASSVSLNAPQRSRSRGGGAMSGDPDRRCTDTLLWANGIGYVLQILSGHAFTSLGAKVNSKIAAGQVWRLVTPVVLHGGLMHLAVNCMSLNTLGPAVEKSFGKEQFWAVYLASAIGGNALSYRFCPNDAVGASSSIFGLVGAMGVYLQRHNDLFGDRGQRMLESLLGSVAVNAAFGMMSKRIDNYAHLGGFLAGGAVAFTCGPNFIQVSPKEAAREAALLYKKTGALPTGISQIAGRAVVNRPLAQTYASEFVKAFQDEDDE